MTLEHATKVDCAPVSLNNNSEYCQRFDAVRFVSASVLMFICACVADPYGRSPPFAPLGALGSGAFGGLGSPTLGESPFLFLKKEQSFVLTPWIIICTVY